MTADFSRVRFIMTEPSHPGNVGSAARAIKTMGFQDLVLVAPKTPDATSHPDAIALASGATDVLESATIVDTLAEALSPVTLAFALTARSRDLGPPPCDIRQAANFGFQHLSEHQDAKIAVVLGTERSGLTNAQVALCQRICHIPANPAYSSLNVSQALQLAAWELRYALLAGTATSPDNGGVDAVPTPTAPNLLPPVAPGRAEGSRPASGQAVQAFLTHFEEALVAVKFLDPQHPKKLMPRMHHLFGRAGLSKDEVDMLRGVCTAMLATARGQFRNKPGERGGPDTPV